MRGNDGTGRGRGGNGRKECRGGHAEAHFLALHIAARDTKRMVHRVTGRFRAIRHRNATGEQQQHRRQDRPALPDIADRLAKGDRQPRAEHEHAEQLHKIADRRRVFERVRRIGVEEAAAIGAEQLDRELRRHRPERDDLFGTLDRRRADRCSEGLRHAERDIDQRKHDARGQEQVQRDARDIDPEIADPLGLPPREATDQRERHRKAGRRRQEILHRQPDHLRQMRQRAFAAVILPIGVGDETDRGVEGEQSLDRGEPLRIERQDALQLQHREQERDAEQVECHQRNRVADPALFGLWIDADQLEQHALTRQAIARIQRMHPVARRLGERHHDGGEEHDQAPSSEGHPALPLNTARAVRARRAGKQG